MFLEQTPKDRNRMAGEFGLPVDFFYREQSMGTLSGGEKVKAQMLRLLIAGPDVIFADEPTGNLDSRSGAEVMKMLGDIRSRMNKTLVVITHDSRIAQMAERRLVIMDGILTEEGVAGR